MESRVTLNSDDDVINDDIDIDDDRGATKSSAIGSSMTVDWVELAWEQTKTGLAHRQGQKTP